MKNLVMERISTDGTIRRWVARLERTREELDATQREIEQVLGFNPAFLSGLADAAEVVQGVEETLDGLGPDWQEGEASEPSQDDDPSWLVGQIAEARAAFARDGFDRNAKADYETQENLAIARALLVSRA